MVSPKREIIVIVKLSLIYYNTINHIQCTTVLTEEKNQRDLIIKIFRE